MFVSRGVAPPEDAATIQRVLAIPPKRHEKNLVIYLTEDEADADRSVQP
nr:hypothetical protein [Candidatus Microthrix sp.]